jgi:hypothetical protein
MSSQPNTPEADELEQPIHRPNKMLSPLVLSRIENCYFRCRFRIYCCESISFPSIAVEASQCEICQAIVSA